MTAHPSTHHSLPFAVISRISPAVLPSTLMSVSLALMGALPAVSQAQTLEQTVGLALQQQMDVRLAGLQVQSQQAQLEQITAQKGWKLNAMAELGVGYVQVAKGALFPKEGNRVPQTLGLQWSYPIYTAGRTELAQEAARAGILAAESQQQAVADQTRFAAVSVHSALVRDQAIRQLEKQSQQTLDRAARDAGKRLKAGEVTKTDLAQAEARQAQGLASQSQAEANLALDKIRYQQLTGQSLVAIPERLPAPPVPPALNAALDQLENTPVLEALRQQVRASEQQYAIAQRGLKPSVQFTGSLNTQKGSVFSTDRLSNYGVSLQASVPILDGGSNRAEQQRAAVDVDIAKTRLEQTRQQLREQLQRSYTSLTLSRQQQPALIESERAAELAANTIEKELELGTRTTFDLLTAQRDLLAARTQRVLNQEEQLIRSYQVWYDLGKISQVVPGGTLPLAQAEADTGREVIQ